MIIATAGHVDHGKTTLIRALSGVDTDRLPEEKKRGLSIDLGFAYLPHPQQNNCTLGFIDVPGHEKFVRNMIAGVGAVDLALLVVAADDGPMPQTREHLAILQLLGIERLIVVISKVDLVQPSQITRVQTALGRLIDRRRFARVETFCVSAQLPDTVDVLRSHLFVLAEQAGGEVSSGYFRLAIDRSFSVAGAGTVVTGTVMSGCVRVEDTLQLLSSGAGVRVRGIRAQDTTVSQAFAGQRCALNIVGNGKRHSLPRRGDWVIANTALRTTQTIDVRLQSVAETIPARGSHTQGHQCAQFAHWTPGHLHLATASTTCRVALLTGESLMSGQSALARIYCDKAFAAIAGDKFVLRDQSARKTIAGGVVIDPLPPGRGRSRDDRLQLLEAMQAVHPLEALTKTLAASSFGVDLNGFIARYNSTREELLAMCTQLSVVRCESTDAWWGVGPAHWPEVVNTLLQTLEQWHRDYPLLLGASIDQLQKQTRPVLAEAVVLQVIQALIQSERVSRKGAVYRCSGWISALDEKHEAIWVRVLSQLQAAGNTAPRIVELAETLELTNEEVVKYLNTYVAHGRLYRVSENRYYLPATLLQLAHLAQALAQRKELTVAAYRDESAIGRNLVIELLEYFDRMQFTRRTGQQRVVLRSAISVFDSD